MKDIVTIAFNRTLLVTLAAAFAIAACDSGDAADEYTDDGQLVDRLSR